MRSRQGGSAAFVPIALSRRSSTPQGGGLRSPDSGAVGFPMPPGMQPATKTRSAIPRDVLIRVLLLSVLHIGATSYNLNRMKVAILMGSDSDLEAVQGAIDVL